MKALTITSVAVLSIACLVPIWAVDQPQPPPRYSIESTHDGMRIRGDREGNVLVEVADSGKLIHQFSMGPGVVRGAFVLQGGTALAASQLNQSRIWNLRNGAEIARLPYQIFAVSPDGGSYLGVDNKADRDLAIYVYPGVRRLWKLPGFQNFAPLAAIFSPDSRFLVVQFHSYCPIPDEYYPKLPPRYSSVYGIKLYDLMEQKEIPEFSAGVSHVIGRFSEEADYYVVDGSGVEKTRFNLASRKWESF